MSEKYKTAEKEKAYFVTFTITEWLNVLQNDSSKMIIVETIRFYQKNRGLIIYAYCIMPNHIHLIAQSNADEELSAIIRDIKKYTAKLIIKKLENDNNEEGKKALKVFSDEGKRLKRITKYKVWQDGNRPMVLYSNKFIWQKLDYIHNNPVEYGLAAKAEEYMFSSARNYSEIGGLIEIEYLTRELKTVK
jgi:REP element-mobilizing transposase RayT